MSNVLFIGAPGNISASTIQDLSEQGHSLFALTHYKTNLKPYEDKVTFFFGDRDCMDDLTHARDTAKAEIVIDFSCFLPEQAQMAVDVFQSTVEQYIFVSTVDVYGYPLSQLPMPENGSWNAPNCSYAANKVQCEMVFRNVGQEKLPLTIVRPAYSMGNRFLLTALSRGGGYTLIPRLRQGKPIFSPGDGTALIHAGNGFNTGRMIACIAGDSRCVGEDFTLAHDKIGSYDDYITLVADLLGVKPNFVHIPTDFVYAQKLDGIDTVLLNDLTRYNVYFDISKFRRFFPEFQWTKSLRQSMKEYIEFNEGNWKEPSSLDLEDQLIRTYLG